MANDVETFGTGSDGYDLSWGEFVGTGCTVDEDKSGVTGATGDVLECSSATSGFQCNGLITASQTTRAQCYVGFRWQCPSESLSNSDSSAYVLVLMDSGANWCAWCTMQKTAGGQLQLKFFAIDGGEIGTYNISTGTWYEIECAMDFTGNTVQWVVDGNDIGTSSSETTRANSSQTYVGHFVWANDYTFTSYYDIIQWNDWANDWVFGGPSAGAEVTDFRINIGDSWKSISGASMVKINIGDTWKTVSSMKVNIGDAWKTIF